MYVYPSETRLWGSNARETVSLLGCHVFPRDRTSPNPPPTRCHWSRCWNCLNDILLPHYNVVIFRANPEGMSFVHKSNIESTETIHNPTGWQRNHETRRISPCFVYFPACRLCVSKCVYICAAYVTIQHATIMSASNTTTQITLKYINRRSCFHYISSYWYLYSPDKNRIYIPRDVPFIILEFMKQRAADNLARRFRHNQHYSVDRLFFH